MDIFTIFLKKKCISMLCLLTAANLMSPPVILNPLDTAARPAIIFRGALEMLHNLTDKPVLVGEFRSEVGAGGVGW